MAAEVFLFVLVGICDRFGGDVDGGDRECDLSADAGGAGANGVPIGTHRARQLKRSDYDAYDLLIEMDEENMFYMKRILGEDPEGKIHYLMEYSGRPDEIDVAMLNPVIVKRTGLYETEEGCLSLSGSRKTKRYQEIALEYQDLNMQKHRQKFSGWTAQIIQHECDHLEGIII